MEVTMSDWEASECVGNELAAPSQGVRWLVDDRSS